MAATAYEAVSSRMAWYSATVLAKYAAVMIDTAGKVALSDGTRHFVGIVQYGAEVAGDMVTVVKGAFPTLATENVAVGDKLTIDSTDPGKFRIADVAADLIYGVALTAADEGDLFTILMNDVTFSVPAGV